MPRPTDAERRIIEAGFPLTDREREALDILYRKGGSRKAAACALGMSRRTLDRLLADAFAKFDVDNAGAAGRAFGRAENGANTPLTE